MSKSRKLRRQEQREHKHKVSSVKTEKKKGLRKLYEDKYKLLMILPFLLLVLAIGQISFQYATTGNFIHRDISLKGGISLNVLKMGDKTSDQLSSYLSSNYPYEISVRSRIFEGKEAGYLIEADIPLEDKAGIDKFTKDIFSYAGIDYKEDNYSLVQIGSTLSHSFFVQTVTALLIAFLCMGLVVFIYFRTAAPSLAVILAAFSDIVVTLAIVNLLEVKISTAGIAAFLMMIGYSVDTDILLTTKLIKRQEGTILTRVYSAMKTGMTMNVTSIIAILIAMIVTNSEVIHQIMLILFIGLLVDMINTWIQNVGILRIYLESKTK